MELILASNSPRRKQLLEEMGLHFSVVTSGFEENDIFVDPVKTAERFAEGKAESVFRSLKKKDNCVVLGADTVVYHEGEIFGKPDSESQAREMLYKLSGKTHTVITGFCLITGSKKVAGHDKTRVVFERLTESVVDKYVKSGLYKGKAGSYGIQDGFPLVKEYHGSLNNVIGLPTEKIKEILNELGGVL